MSSLSQRTSTFTSSAKRARGGRQRAAYPGVRSACLPCPGRRDATRQRESGRRPSSGGEALGIRNKEHQQMRNTLRALPMLAAAAAAIMLPASTAHAADGYDRCPDGYYCMFSGLDGTGDMIKLRGSAPDLAALGMNDRAKSDWNRTASTIYLWSDRQGQLLPHVPGLLQLGAVRRPGRPELWHTARRRRPRSRPTVSAPTTPVRSSTRPGPVQLASSRRVVPTGGFVSYSRQAGRPRSRPAGPSAPWPRRAP